MRPLMRDVIRRCWWLFLLGIGGSIVPCFWSELTVTAMGLFSLAVNGAIFLSVMEANSGVSRIHVALPVQRKTLERFIWFEHVLLFPLLFAAVQFLGALVAWTLPWCNGAQLLMLVCTSLMSIGTLAAFFLLAGPGIAYPHVPRNLIAAIGQGVRGLLLTALMLGSLVAILLLTDAHPSRTSTRCMQVVAYLFDLGRLSPFRSNTEPALSLAIVLAAIALGIIVASYLLRARNVGRLISTPLGGPKTFVSRETAARIVYRPRWIGRAWIWIHFALSISWSALVILLLLEFCFLMLQSQGSEIVSTLASSRELPMGLLVLTCFMVVGACLPWINALRTFRMLPVTRARLVLLVLSLPSVCFAAIIPYLVIAAAVSHEFAAFPPYFIAAVVGFGAAIFGCALFVAYGLIAAMLYVLFGGFLIAGLYFLSPPAGVIASVVLAGLGLHVLYRAICNSSGAYRSKFVGPDSSLYR